MSTTIQVKEDLTVSGKANINGIDCTVEKVAFDDGLTKASKLEQLVEAMAAELISQDIVRKDGSGDFYWTNSGELLVETTEYKKARTIANFLIYDIDGSDGADFVDGTIGIDCSYKGNGDWVIDGEAVDDDEAIDLLFNKIKVRTPMEIEKIANSITADFKNFDIESMLEE